MSRTVAEWIGKTDDAHIPPRVRLRLFERFGGACACCGRKLTPGKWSLDHTVALINGGSHAEKNLRPVCNDPCHRNKSRSDTKEKAQVARKAMMNLGIKPKKRKLVSRGFEPASPQRSASRPLERKQP